MNKATEPVYWRCRECGCLWRDNHDQTISLASANQKSCDACERWGISQVGDALYTHSQMRILEEENIECHRRQAADRKSALDNYAKYQQAERELEVLRPPAQNYNRTLARAERAEAEAARLREELTEALGCLTSHEMTCLKASEAEACVQTLEQEVADKKRVVAAETVYYLTKITALEAQLAALTQERDALRAELLERDDMREGV